MPAAVGRSLREGVACGSDVPGPWVLIARDRKYQCPEAMRGQPVASRSGRDAV
jgi:hypothetical protein